MKLKLDTLPELPAEEHPFFLLPERQIQVEIGTGPGPSIELAYRESGNGPAVLLLHGLWTSSYSFRSLIPLLSATHRVILPELLDLSGKNLLPDGDYLPERLAGLIGGLCRALSLSKPVIVGHAECGLGALQLGLLQPELPSTVVVLGSSLGLPRTLRLRGKLLRSDTMRERWARRAFRRPLREALRMIEYADPAVVSRQEVRRLALGWANLPGARARARVLAQTLGSGYAHGLTEQIKSLAAAGRPFPVRLILAYGDSDRRAPKEHGERLNQMFPGSELMVAEHSSGAVQVEKPEWTARIIASALVSSPGQP